MIEVKNLILKYHCHSERTLNAVNFHAKAGELVLITGPTGCGKSTLLNCLNGIMHHESSTVIEGSVFIGGQDIRNMKLAEICRFAGTVFQNPESQICTATPETEIAFGLENTGMPRNIIYSRIDESLEITGLSSYRKQPAVTLSGGQKQRLALACALALKPKVLLLDEPISQLDPKGAREILNVIHILKENSKLTVVIVEHRIEETISLADRIVIMDRGKIISDMAARKALDNLSVMRELGLNLPHLPDLFERLKRHERPLFPSEAPIIKKVKKYKKEMASSISNKTVCEIKNMFFSYNKQKTPNLHDLSLTLTCGECIALMGSNGAGKSTLLNLLAGMQKPDAGSITWFGKPNVGMVMQSPDLMLFSESVYDEVAFAAIHSENSEKKCDFVVKKVMTNMGITHLAERAPFALSRGQRLRTAVASILSKEPSILLLDEPTTGQDKKQIERMMEALKESFDLLVFCTHDVDTAARHANRIILMDRGRIIADDKPINILFNKTALEQASIRQTSIQTYAELHGIQALSVDTLFEVFS